MQHELGRSTSHNNVRLKNGLAEELGVLVAETIRLRGEFIIDEANKDIAENDFLIKLKLHFENLRQNSSNQHGNIVVYVPKDLGFCNQVLLKDDTVKAPLKAPYDGLYTVLERHPKTCTILIGTKLKTVSTGRLKPPYVPTEVSQLEKRCRKPPS